MPPQQKWNAPAQETAQAEYVAAEVGEYEEGEDDEHQTGDYQYGKKKNRFFLVFVFLIGLIAVGSGVAYWLYKSNQSRAIAQLKTDFRDNMSKQRWDEALAKAQAYREKISDSNEIKDVDFAITWCKLQLALMPSQLNDVAGVKKGIEELVNYSKTRKSEKQFADYRKDLFVSAYQLIITAADKLQQQPDAAAVESLREVVKVMQENSSAFPEPDKVPIWMEEVGKKIETVSSTLTADVALQQLLADYNSVINARDISKIDDVQLKHNETIKQHPQLANHQELNSKLTELKEAEPSWVIFSKKDDSPAPVTFSYDTSLRICPPVKTTEGAVDDNGVVMVMARGTLYGLSAKTGKDLWALRVGRDLKDLPPRISVGGDQSDIAFVVTAETTEKEGNQTYLSAMKVHTGERLWSRRLIGACPAGPIILGSKLAVPMNGGLCILEASDGKMTGLFNLTGYDLSIPPAFDKTRNRLFVPVDRRRVFVLDLNKNQCVGVIYTEHQAGGLQGSPIVIEDTLIVCTTSGSGVGTTHVLAFDIKSSGDDRRSAFEQIASFDITGHASSTPYVDGNTIGVVTDRGMLALFGVGKGAPPDSKGSSPLFPLSKPMQVRPPVASETRGTPNLARSQVAHVNLTDWWIFTQDQLIRNTFDPFTSQLLASPVGSIPLGTPLHRSSLSPDGRYLIAVTQPKNQTQIIATAIDCTTGQPVWQTQIGTVVSEEPMALGDSVAMLDRAGAIFLVQSSEISSAAQWQVCGSWPALPLLATSHRLVRSSQDQSLVSVSFDNTRKRLIVRVIDLKTKSATTKEFPLSYAPVGTPAGLPDGSILIPSRDGNIYHCNFAATTIASLFAWRDPSALPSAAGHLALPTPRLLIATNGNNKLLRWEKTAQGNWRKISTDLELPARINSPILLVSDSMIAVSTDSRQVHALPISGLVSPQSWNVGGDVTKGPYRVGVKGLGCIVDGKTAWWVNQADGDKPKLFAADAIIGEGTTVGNELVLATLKRERNLGMLAGFTWVDVESGKPKQESFASLPIGLAPASGPVALGRDRVFAPLTDGTIRILSRKAEQQAIANP